MEITLRAFLTALHGMLFGGLFLLAIYGLIVELYRSAHASQPSTLTAMGYSLGRFYLILMAALGWAAVLLGAYVVYPWYRAAPPAGVRDLTGYPQRLLLSSAATSGWHSLGMEWKEHVAWLAPIAMTMTAYIFTRQRRAIQKHPRIRTAVLVFTLIAFFAAGVAGFFGVMINKNAPVKGGSAIGWVSGGK